MQAQSLHKRQLGMSIVELMVAIVISLLGVLVIFQVFAVNEGVRRSTTAGSDEQTSGLLALMLLERELRHAGFGINDFDMIGCNMRTYDNARVPAMQPDFPLTAVEIVSNVGTTPDVLRVAYGGVSQTTAAVKFGNDMDDTIQPIQLTFRFGFNTGDVVVVGQPGSDCTLREITGLPGLIELEHGTNSYLNTVTGESQSPRFNNPAGTPVPYKFMQEAKVMNLGQFPARNEITVVNDDPDPSRNNQLVVQNMWGQMAAFTPMAEQIVHFKAEYGMDDGKDNGSVVRAVFAADDNVVDNFTTVSPANPADWARVRSVRLAIVSRTNIIEKPISGTACDATPDFGLPNYPVRWARGPDAPAGRLIDVRTTPNWRCFKYRVYETTVPLRNMLWRQG
jgi:type IV pilus assembly protein PilW